MAYELSTTFDGANALKTEPNPDESKLEYTRRHCRRVLASQKIVKCVALMTNETETKRRDPQSDADFVKDHCKALEALL